jgi:hypothetical protein
MKDNITPSHYSDMVIPPNVYITANNLDWEIGNVVKYVSRFKSKNKAEDLFKAIKYIQMSLERHYNIKTELKTL